MQATGLSLAAFSAACLIAASAHGALIHNYVVYSAGSVQVGVGTDVTGQVGAGTFITMNGTATVTGDTIAGTNVSLANNAHIYGALMNPGSLTLGAGATTGTRTIAAPAQPALPGMIAFSAGGANQTVGNGGTISLTPGIYGTLTMGGAATLNFNGAGDYFIDAVTGGNSMKVNINAGSGNVRIFLVGRWNFGGLATMTVTGGDANSIFLETHSNGTGANAAFKIGGGGGTNWYGTVFAPLGDIHLGSGSSQGTLDGHFWSGTLVDLEHGLTVVPAPAACGVALLGGLLAARRRRR